MSFTIALLVLCCNVNTATVKAQDFVVSELQMWSLICVQHYTVPEAEVQTTTSAPRGLRKLCKQTRLKEDEGKEEA